MWNSTNNGVAPPAFYAYQFLAFQLNLVLTDRAHQDFEQFTADGNFCHLTSLEVFYLLFHPAIFKDENSPNLKLVVGGLLRPAQNLGVMNRA